MAEPAHGANTRPASAPAAGDRRMDRLGSEKRACCRRVGGNAGSARGNPIGSETNDARAIPPMEAGIDCGDGAHGAFATRSWLFPSRFLSVPFFRVPQ